MACGRLGSCRPASGLGLIVVLAAFAGVAFGPRCASALQIRVNSTNDPGSPGICTLRDAIKAANTDAPVNGCTTGSGDDTIVFTLTLPAKILLTAELMITDNLTINGPAVGVVAVDGNTLVRVFDNPGSTLIINNLTVQNGKMAGVGGGIYNNGTLTMTNCIVSGSTASTDGGGIYNDGSGALTLTACTLSGNTATAGAGGGVYNNGTIVALTNCTLSGNTAGTDGGGLWNNGEMLNVTGCTFSDNKAPNGCGGGLFNGVSEVTVTNCTFSGNSATNGGGFCNTSVGATMANCTLSGNSATGLGGALFNSTPFTLTNTIMANSGAGKDCFNNGSITNSHNLIETDSSGGNECSDGMNGDIVGSDPLLSQLANHGGLTQTFALCTAAGLPDASCTGRSPAIDAGDDSVTGPPLDLKTDQRGRPRLQFLHVDIGSFEVQPPPPNPAPALSTMGMILLTALLGAFGWWRPGARRMPR